MSGPNGLRHVLSLTEAPRRSPSVVQKQVLLDSGRRAFEGLEGYWKDGSC